MHDVSKGLAFLLAPKEDLQLLLRREINGKLWLESSCSVCRLPCLTMLHSNAQFYAPKGQTIGILMDNSSARSSWEKFGVS